MQPVTIYTRQFCGFCTAAKRLLEQKGVDFVEHDATFSKELRAEMVQRAGGRSTFPQVFIGDAHVGGCDELHGLERDGRLDRLLKAEA
jgi:glutaredoxin 3